jgi:hypothetical protein
LRRHRVHCIPHPTSVTIAKRPSREGGTAEGTTNFGFSEIEIFWRRDWTAQISMIPLTKLVFSRMRIFAPRG